MTTLIFDVKEKDVEKASSVVYAILENLKDQGAPLDDNLELHEGWYMTWETDINREQVRFRISDEDE